MTYGQVVFVFHLLILLVVGGAWVCWTSEWDFRWLEWL